MDAATVNALAAVATAIFTLGAAIAAGYYCLLTYRLWTETAKQREAQLMLRLMEGYDGLRGSIEELRGRHMESAEAGVDACERFADATGEDNIDKRTAWIDDQRFRVSRFFVSVRKRTRAGYLNEDLVWQALGGQAIEDVFLKLVDPLDEAKAGHRYGVSDKVFVSGPTEQALASTGPDQSVAFTPHTVATRTAARVLLRPSPPSWVLGVGVLAPGRCLNHGNRTALSLQRQDHAHRLALRRASVVSVRGRHFHALRE